MAAVNPVNSVNGERLGAAVSKSTGKTMTVRGFWYGIQVYQDGGGYRTYPVYMTSRTAGRVKKDLELTFSKLKGAEYNDAPEAPVNPVNTDDSNLEVL